MTQQRHTRRAAPAAALLLLGALTAGAVAYGGWDGPSLATKASALAEDRVDIVTSTGVHAFSIEVARTPEQQALGLMFRTELGERKGMLFPHDTPRESSMWMRNTYIPLDMVFILADGTVHRIEKRTEPFSERIISSNGPVAAVLEIAGGTADKLDLKPGDKVRHPLFEAAGK